MSEEIADKLPTVTDMEWQEVNEYNRKITEEFLQESVNLSTQTLNQYKSGLRIFFRFVMENLDNIPITEIKSRDFLKYQNYLIRRGLSSSAVRLKRAAISSLNGYIITYYEDEFPTFKSFITKKITAPEQAFVHEKKPLNPDEYIMLVDELEKREEWQKIAYLKFTYSTGCRRAESRQLLKEIINYKLITKEKKIKNEDGKEETKIANYYITHEIRCKGGGKIGKVRKMKFDESAMEAIKKWLEVRGEDDCPYVFISNYNKQINQISISTFNGWCSELFSEIVGRRVHPHLFRESKATNLVVYEGKSLETAQALLGHKSSETTKIYVIKDDEEDSDDAFFDD